MFPLYTAQFLVFSMVQCGFGGGVGGGFGGGVGGGFGGGVGGRGGLWMFEPNTYNNILAEISIKIKGASTIIHDIIDNPDPHNVFSKKVTTIITRSFMNAVCNNPLKESTQICIKLNIK